MARRTKAAIAAAAAAAEATPPPPEETPAAEGAETPTRRRRRRRTVAAPDYANETVTLVEAVLKGRGSRGATPETLQAVVNWARTVRGEGDALKELAGRPRRQKAQAAGDRIVKFEMNRALLDGVLAGAIALDVQEDGSLVFMHASAAGGNASPNGGVPGAESESLATEGV
jgi:hypothetical protein